jgi:hypothetical protein
MVCAYFMTGGIAPTEFVAALAELGDDRSEQIDQVYCEHWRLMKNRQHNGSRFVRCRDGDHGAFAVTGIDIAKWAR